MIKFWKKSNFSVTSEFICFSNSIRKVLDNKLDGTFYGRINRWRFSVFLVYSKNLTSARENKYCTMPQVSFQNILHVSHFLRLFLLSCLAAGTFSFSWLFSCLFLLVVKGYYAKRQKYMLLMLPGNVSLEEKIEWFPKYCLAAIFLPLSTKVVLESSVLVSLTSVAFNTNERDF